MSNVYISHSGATRYEVCPRQYQARYEERLDTIASSVNLGFGGSVDDGASAFIVGHALGMHVDPIPIFERSFEEFCNSHIVEYSTRWAGKDECLEVGRVLLQQFMERWNDWGYTAVIGADGKPLVQVELRLQLDPRTIFTAIIDVIALNRDGKVIVMDLKTPSQAAPDGFVDTSTQLTGYQLAAMAHRERLGIDTVDGLAFLEMIKRPIPKRNGAGPQVMEPVEVAPRSQQELDAFVQSRIWIADDIRRKRFPKRSLDAYNSPCALCDVRNWCTTGSMEGLVQRPPRPKLELVPARVAIAS